MRGHTYAPGYLLHGCVHIYIYHKYKCVCVCVRVQSKGHTLLMPNFARSVFGRTIRQASESGGPQNSRKADTGFPCPPLLLISNAMKGDAANSCTIACFNSIKMTPVNYLILELLRKRKHVSLMHPQHYSL